MGAIVRTMFASFYLYDAGFGDADLSLFSEVDHCLGESVSSDLDAPWNLRSNAIPPTARLLALYDNQLQTTPIRELMTGHQQAEENFRSPPQKRLSIAALVQRSQRKNRRAPGAFERKVAQHP
ncbi:uncharacterized protein BRPE67_BCDS10680 [Caballeronia cordobensis]|nr:uncharacterized protein BRPE67_BCDS10680 [Burkholderia sp. RPE67]